jgi:hypothetical protein
VEKERGGEAPSRGSVGGEWIWGIPLNLLLRWEGSSSSPHSLCAKILHPSPTRGPRWTLYDSPIAKANHDLGVSCPPSLELDLSPSPIPSAAPASRYTP